MPDAVRLSAKSQGQHQGFAALHQVLFAAYRPDVTAQTRRAAFDKSIERGVDGVPVQRIGVGTTAHDPY